MMPYCDTVRALVKELGADLGAKRSDGETPLHIAAVCGFTDCTRVLLELGADVGSTNDDLSVPLHLAASCDHSDVALNLLEFGADIVMADRDGNTPLHYAAFGGYVAVVRSLLQAIGDSSVVYIRNNDGDTALECAPHDKRGALAAVL